MNVYRRAKSLILRFNGEKFIILIALVFSLSIIAILNFTDLAYKKEFLPPDSFTYINAANSLYQHFQLSPTRPIGYAIILGVPNLFYNNPSADLLITWSFLFNYIIWFATVYFLFKSVSLFVCPKIAFLSTIVFIFCISNIAQTSVILTEGLSCFLLIYSCYYLALFTTTKKSIFMGISFLIMNFIILVKPGFVYAIIGLNILFFGYHILRNRRLSLKILIPLLLIFTLTFTQCFYNLKKRGNFTLSYIGNYTWYLYVGTEASADSKNVSFSREAERRNKMFESLSMAEKYTFSKEDLMSQLKENKYFITKHLVLNIIENSQWGNHHISAVGYKSRSVFLSYIRHYLYIFSKIQNICFSLIAVFLCIGFIFTGLRKSILMWMICGFIFYVMFTSGISFKQGDRFHLILYPLIILGSTIVAEHLGWFQIKKFN